ncbi:hypothetical protein MSPP1_003671 [Malassezia sp. CBS 17886]|nr:hypothetical protein MSPP1_003671 [Malassezia sp. CBS 17886]
MGSSAERADGAPGCAPGTHGALSRQLPLAPTGAPSTAGAALPIPPRAPADPPRTLWKGCLVLHDGTQLPGCSIVSYMQPWAHLHSAGGAGAHARGKDELTAEAELCLALEMVRHQPLLVKRADAQRTHGPPPSVHASGAIHLCVRGVPGLMSSTLDAAESATVAYFERVFCEDAERTHTLVALAYDPSMRTQAPASAALGGSSAALEFVLMGWAAPGDGCLSAAPTLDLVVGLASRRAPSAAPRPDDPFPRAALQRVSTNGKSAAPHHDAASGWESSDEECPPSRARHCSRVDVRIRKRGQLTLSPERVRTAHTPGRRGEKRASAADRATRQARDGVPPEPKPCSWRPVARLLGARLSDGGTAPPTDPSTEAQNRAMIKKLVRYQLGGRGMEREHRDHAACFQTTYAGTCFVFVCVGGV